MKKSFWIAKGLKMLVLAIAAGVLFTFVVMWLWNWLMPTIFGLSIITFWQALGLLVLSKILFGGKGWGRRRHSHGHYKSSQWKKNLHEKWNNMSAEEKEALKAQMKSRCRSGRWQWNDDLGTNVENQDKDKDEA